MAKKRPVPQEVQIAGQRMSNWLYNMAQKDAFKDNAKAMFELVKAWDISVRDAYKPKKKEKVTRA